MDQVQGFDRISFRNHARDIYLRCALTNHFDVHIAICQGTRRKKQGERGCKLKVGQEDGKTTEIANLNIFPAIPTMFFIFRPTRERIAIWSKTDTSPISFSSLSIRSKPLNLWISLTMIAILTWTSLVEIRSTAIPNLSKIPNIRAKNPCEMVFWFE